MNVWHLVLREISHRKLNFALGLLSVSVAVACLVGALTLLRADEIRTASAGKDLENAMRKITKGMGFNVFIFNKNQDLNELHVKGVASTTMPESYVDQLAKSDIVTVNHLLPTVSKRLTWPETSLPIILTGTRGEVPLKHRDLKKPLQEKVPRGTMLMGYQLHKQLKLSKDEKVKLMGREFTVTNLFKERGTADDSTVWIHLSEAQELLDMENLVNAILALECNCATEDRIAEIREDIAAILPGTLVIERGDVALARAEARNKAKKVAVAAMKQHESFATILVPLAVVACVVWVGFLTFGNVRQRSAEIGILRAIGLRTMQILLIFLAKAFLVGLLGAVIGYVAGFTVGAAWAGETAAILFTPGLLLLALIMAPFLSGLASWIPAMLAARQDPAVVLQGD